MVTAQHKCIHTNPQNLLILNEHLMSEYISKRNNNMLFTAVHYVFIFVQYVLNYITLLNYLKQI